MSHLLKKKKLPKIESEQAEELKEFREFDEMWERILYRACMNDPYLSNRVFSISKLLNLFREITKGNDERLGQIIESILEFSSVTQVESSDKSVIDIHKASVLYAINEKLLPSLRSKLKNPYKIVEKQGTRVQTTLRYKFSKYDWEDFIILVLDVSGGKIILRVGNYMNLIKKRNNDAMKDIESSGGKELFDKILIAYEELNRRYPPFRYEKKPKECLVNGRGKNMHRLEIFYILEEENKNELILNPFIEKLANLITDYMQAYHLVKQMQQISYKET